MKTIAVMLAVMAAAAFARPAYASYFKTASDVQEVCTIAEAELVCSAYLAGVVDSIWSNHGELVGNKICLPDGISEEQVRVAFLKFLQKRPDFGKATAASVVAAALTEAYPCEESSNH